MKTSKDKAFDMVLKYVAILPIDFSRGNKEAIECAKIAVDEIIEQFINLHLLRSEIIYWQEVKNELNKML